MTAFIGAFPILSFAEDIVARLKGSKRTLDGSGTLSVDWGADVEIGDYGIVLLQTDQGDSISAPDGTWDHITQRDSATHRVTIYGKFLTDVDDFDVSNSGNHIVAATLAFGNVDPAEPIEDTDGNFIQVDSVNVNIPNPTITRPRSYILSIVGHDINSNSSQCSFNNNSSLESTTELIDYCSTVGWDGGFAAAGGIKAAVGSINNTTGTLNTGKWQTRLSIAFNPES